MEYGWITIFNAVIILLILIPNIVYAIKQPKAENKVIIPRWLTILEQIGRYGCMLLMLLPLFVLKFGFRSVEEMLCYFVFNAILLVAYYVIWVMYAKNKTVTKAIDLAVLPTAIFLMTGLLLSHWLLVVFAVIFGYAHIKITKITHDKE